MRKKSFMLLVVHCILALLTVMTLTGVVSAKVEITVWDKVSEPAGGIDKFTKELQKEFDEKHPNIKVTHLQAPGSASPADWNKILITAWASGTAPSVVNCFINTTDAITYGIRGYVADLGQYVKNWDDWKLVYKNVRKDITMDGHVYGIPNGVHITTLAYRKDMFDDAGLNPNRGPQTWSELATYAQKLTNSKVGRYGYTLLGADVADWWFQYFVWQAGGDLTTLNKDGTLKLKFADPAVVKALEFYQDLVYKYKCVQKNVLMDFGNLLSDWFGNRVAMTYFYPTWLNWQIPSGLKPEVVNLAVLPKLNKSVTAYSSTCWSITAKQSSEEIKASWEYVKFMLGHDTILERLKWAAKNEVQYLDIPMYEDIQFENYMNVVPKQWVGVIKESVGIARGEYYGKGALTSFLVSAIQAALVSEKANPRKELEKAEDKAQKEFVESYNRKVKDKLD